MCSFFNQVICTKGWDALIGQALVTCPLLKPEMLGSQLYPTTSPEVAWGWGSSPRELEHCYQKQGSGWVAGKPANDHHSCSLSFHPPHLSHLVFCPWMLRHRFSRHWNYSFPKWAAVSTAYPHPCCSFACNSLCDYGELYAICKPSSDDCHLRKPS